MIAEPTEDGVVMPRVQNVSNLGQEFGEIVLEAVETRTLHLGDVLRPSFRCGWCRFAYQGKW